MSQYLPSRSSSRGSITTDQSTEATGQHRDALVVSIELTTITSTSYVPASSAGNDTKDVTFSKVSGTENDFGSSGEPANEKYVRQLDEDVMNQDNGCQDTSDPLEVEDEHGRTAREEFQRHI